MKLEKLVQFGSFAIIAIVAVVWLTRMGGEAQTQKASMQTDMSESAPELSTDIVPGDGAPTAVEFVPPEEGFLTATSLTYQEVEPGIAPYTTRVLVTDDFVRFDDGHDGSDYVLYDRRVRSIYSVAHANRMIVHILHRDMLLPQPEDLRIETDLKELEDAPTVAERRPVEIVYSANGASCQQAVVVPGLMPDVAAALREYEQTVAGQSYSTLENTPPEMRSPCFMANNLFIAGEYLETGIPLQSSNYRGEEKLLTDYQQDLDMPSSLFDINDEYFVMSLNQSI